MHRKIEKPACCQTESQGLRATATVEGDLTITSGNEVQAILARGVTCLKDGAISGNGKSAATLSYELSNGKRKIQMLRFVSFLKTLVS